MNQKQAATQEQEPRTPKGPVGPNDLSLHDAAVFYARSGMKVFPLTANSKLPIKKVSWLKLASSDPDTVSRYWTKMPDANIGMVTGAANRITVLDLDEKDGAQGIRSHQGLIDAPFSGSVQTTPTNGGKHLLYTYVPGLKNVTHKGEFGGIDIRSDHGFILVAPSVIDGKKYQWAQAGRTPAMPDRLLLECMAWSSSTRDTSDSDTPDIPEDLPSIKSLNLDPKYVDYLLNGNTEHWINEGDGRPDESAAVHACAGALMRKVNDEATVYGLLVDNPYAMACAERHTTHDPERWLWKYGASKAIEANRDCVDSNIDPETYFTPEVERDPDAGPFVSFSEGMATQLKPANWLIGGLIEKGQVGVLYGESGAGKTFAALDIALTLASGKNWHREKVKGPGGVLYVTTEGARGFWRRCAAWPMGYNDQHKANPIGAEDIEAGGFAVSSVAVDMMTPEGMHDIKEQVSRTGNKPQLIVIDTMSGNMSGDENSAKDISNILRTCYLMSKAWDCAVIIVHHPNKGGDELRGSGALFNGSDFVIKLSKVDDVSVQTVKMEQVKCKDGELHAPWFFELKQQFLIDLEDEDGHPSSSLVMHRINAKVVNEQTNAANKKLSKNQLDVLTCTVDSLQGLDLMDPTHARQATAEEMWPAYNTFCTETYGADKKPKKVRYRKILMSLVTDNRLVAVDEPGGPWYEIPTSQDKNGD